MLRKNFRNAPWAVIQADKTMQQEIREVKVCRVSEAELNMLLDSENLSWPRMDLVFNLDSPSTKVRVIHDYTSCIPSAITTLSLEILSAYSGLGILAEAAFNFRMSPFIKSYDISCCYQQIRSVGRFVFISLNNWFDDVETLTGPFVHARESLSFGNPILGLVVELLIYNFVDRDLQEADLQELLSSSRYSDNVNVGAVSVEELNRRCTRVVSSFPKSGFFIEPPIEPWSQLLPNDERLE